MRKKRKGGRGVKGERRKEAEGKTGGLKREIKEQNQYLRQRDKGTRTTRTDARPQLLMVLFLTTYRRTSGRTRPQIEIRNNHSKVHLDG